MWVQCAFRQSPGLGNARNLDPRQKKAQQARLERQRREWADWEASMDTNEESYRRMKGFRRNNKRTRSSEASRVSKVGIPALEMKENTPSPFFEARELENSSPSELKREDRSNLMGNMYTRQRLMEKIDGFSRMVDGIQQAQGQQWRDAEIRQVWDKPATTSQMNSSDLDYQVLWTQVGEEDAWDW